MRSHEITTGRKKCEAVRQLVQKAVALCRRASRDETLAQIGDPEGPFISGRHYIFALDMNGKLLADGMVFCGGFYSFKEDPFANWKL